MSAIQSFGVRLAYSHVDLLIHDTVHKFKRRYGGDYSDLLSVAHEGFLGACGKFKKGRKAKFSTYVRFIMWQWLLETQRRQINKESRKRQLPEDFDVPCKPSRSFCWRKFCFENSPDAVTVLKLVFDPPEEFSQRNTRRRIPQIRQAIVEYLTDIGWSIYRIAEAFDEIKEAL